MLLPPFTGDKVVTDDQEHTKEKDKGGQGIDTGGDPLTRTWVNLYRQGCKAISGYKEGHGKVVKTNR